MQLFGMKIPSHGTISEVAHMVEKYFRDRGMTPQDQQIAGSEGCGWHVNAGSAHVYIFVQEGPNGPILRITSPLVSFPQGNLEAFFHHLLDVNFNLTGCALSVVNNTVLVVAQRSTRQLDQEELEELVWNVAYVADLLDDKLITEYGAQRYKP